MTTVELRKHIAKLAEKETQVKLAKRLGVSQQTISGLINYRGDIKERTAAKFGFELVWKRRRG